MGGYWRTLSCESEYHSRENLRAALHTMSLEQGAAWMKEKYQLDKSISQIIEEVLKIVSDFTGLKHR